MIDDPPVLTLKRNLARPQQSQVDQLKGVATGFVVDCLGGSGAMDAAIKVVNDNRPSFCGVAVTCDAGPADNLAVFGALEIATAGDVLVISTGAYAGCAVIGDLVLGMAKNRGVVASVTDGYVRDIDGINEVGLPCYAAGVTPNSPARNGPGTAGLPVMTGGLKVESGDVVVGDKDGVVVVPREQLDAVLKRLPEVLEAEAELDAKVKAGLELPDFVTGLLSGDSVREIG
jgi:4-hydroxy-4-methyl-2-oxoglutarate aldolase